MIFGYAVPPALAGAIFISNLTSEPSALLNVIALSILFGGFLVVGRLRAALAASETVARAWREERDISVSKIERLELDLVQLQQENSELRIRPDLADVVMRLGRIEGLLAKEGA